jgi:hypothetical protein
METQKAPAGMEELKELLEDVLEVSCENNKILKRMRRDAIVGGILKLLLWTVLIVGSLYFTWRLLAPYTDMVKDIDPSQFQAVIDMYGGKFPGE